MPIRNRIEWIISDIIRQPNVAILNEHGSFLRCTPGHRVTVGNEQGQKLAPAARINWNFKVPTKCDISWQTLFSPAPTCDKSSLVWWQNTQITLTLYRRRTFSQSNRTPKRRNPFISHPLPLQVSYMRGYRYHIRRMTSDCAMRHVPGSAGHLS